jgi:ribosome-binding ATPase YchF (GTP1/OBG family)
MSEKKLIQEELDLVKQLRKEYNEIVIAVGELELQLSSLEKEKQRLLSLYSSISSRETELAQTLNEKYGSGTINLETGIIS